MPSEKPKSGVISALSRILHLHQLPDTPPSTLTSTPSLARPNPIVSGESAPMLPPSYAGKPYVIPEARRAVMPASTISLPQANAPSTPSRPESTANSSPARAVPSVAPVRVATPPTPAPASPRSVWPFPAPWIKSNQPSSSKATPGGANPSPSVSTPATKPSMPVTKPLHADSAPVPKNPAVPTKPSPAVARPFASAPPSTKADAPVPVRADVSIPSTPTAIVTNFDRILDIVRLQKSIKLDELTKRIGMNEEKIAEELQTLEDNGLIEVRYPAFGEPIIYFKNAT